MAAPEHRLFEGETLHVIALAHSIVEVCFDRRNEAINKLDGTTVSELASAVDLIREHPQLRGILVTSAKKDFIVGADIFEFLPLFAQPSEQIAQLIGSRSAVFTAFADLNLPSVTAINGLALGGGFEMAMATDARVMAEDARVGLPEVSLGLFPGFGGTVRLPRLTIAATAVDWICGGKPQTAAKALAAGATDRLAPPLQLREVALHLLETIAASGEWQARRKRRNGPFQPDPQTFAKAKQALAETSVHQCAALAALVMMEQSAPLGRDEALAKESATFGKLARSQATASLVQLFLNDQIVKKLGRGYAKTARKVERAAVLGAGIMGGGIAFTSANHNIPVLMKDINQTSLERGMQEANRLLAKQVQSGRISAEQQSAVLARITPATTYDRFNEVDVVVEAIVEDLNVKRSVLRDLEQHCRPDTIVASNTSSLSISALATGLQRPENLVGMHFFNPVHVMPLVEVVRGRQTSEVAAATIAAYATAMGKTAVVVADCAGFLVNRILASYMLGFLQAIHDGADYLALDRVMEAFGWPMGPAYLQDVIGMDTSAHALGVIADSYSPRMTLDFESALNLLVRHNRLGQKSGRGFYAYSKTNNGPLQKTVDPATAELLERNQPNGPRPMTDEELRDRLMLPMILEAARCLEERVVGTAAEIDLSLTLGIGFPRHLGGPLKYVDWLGLDSVVQLCDRYTGLGPLYRPSESFRNRARSGSLYHPVKLV